MTRRKGSKDHPPTWEKVWREQCEKGYDPQYAGVIADLVMDLDGLRITPDTPWEGPFTMRLEESHAR